jgi:predicted RNA-binding protein with PIN domain
VRVLIVDGYNVIHAWPSLKAVLKTAGLEEARRRLISELSEHAAVSQVRTTVVFDGPRQRQPSGPPEVVDGVTVMFSGRAGSADHLIERLAYDAARAGDAADVTVATSDRLQGDMVRAMGVSTIDARSLESEVRAALADTGTAAERTRDQARFARRIEHHVDAATRARLEELRRGRGGDDADG